MARYVFEENTTVWFVSSISSVTSPTAAEINAGVNLTAWMPRDGLKFGVGDNRVSIQSLGSTFDAEIIGTWAAKLSLDFFRDDSADTAWTTLPYKTSGYVVVRYKGALPTAVAATGNKVMVFPVQSGQRVPNDSAANEKQRFMVGMAVTSVPTLDTSVA